MDTLRERLNIAMLSVHSCPWDRPGGRYTGGMNIYIKELALELGKRGHHVDIYTCSHTDHGHGEIIEINHNIRLVHIGNTHYGSIVEAKLGQYINAIAESIHSYSTELKSHYDIMHSHYWLSGLAGNKLRDHWNVPHITMFHTLGAVKNEAGLGILEPKFRIQGEQQIVKNIDRIVAATARERQALISRYGAGSEKIATIPCGVNFELFRPIEKHLAREISGLDSKKVILFVGRADPLKGLDNLLEAVVLLKHRTDFELLIIGGDGANDNYIKSFIKRAREHNLTGTVHFIGPVNHHDMYVYYNSADFCAIPSYYESFGLVALESLACGTPVMATDVGELKNVSHRCEACRIVPDNRPQNLAKHINAMLDLTGKMADEQKLLRYLCAQYGWSNVTERILSEYEHVLSKSPKFQNVTPYA